MKAVRRQPPSSSRRDPPVVVVGGYDYAPGMNQVSTLTVRELARTRDVLYVHSEVGGSVLNVVRGRGRYVRPRRVARIVVGPTRVRRVEERLWLAPVRGPVAWPPLGYPEPMRRFAVRYLTRRIQGWLDDHGHTTCYLLFYWPELPELTETITHAAAAYDCSEDPASMPGRLSPPDVIEGLERRLIAAVDRTWVVSPGLLAGREGLGAPVMVKPTAIDLRRVAQITAQPPLDVPQLRSRSGPVVGYAGGLTDRLDWELIDELAARRPGWTFLFVGGDPTAAPHSLHQRDNVAFTGLVPYDFSLRAVARFDVGVIPVRSQGFSQGNSFMKLLDYLVSGVPVVASDVPDTQIAAARAPGAVAVATGTDAWLEALEAAIRKDHAVVGQAGAAFVADRSNERRVAALVAGLEEDRRARVRVA